MAELFTPEIMAQIPVVGIFVAFSLTLIKYFMSFIKDQRVDLLGGLRDNTEALSDIRVTLAKMAGIEIERKRK